LGERGISGPRKITVGCVIFTVPRRNRVSHAVADETARARIETVIEMGSAIVGSHQKWLDQGKGGCGKIERLFVTVRFVPPSTTAKFPSQMLLTPPVMFEATALK